MRFPPLVELLELLPPALEMEDTREDMKPPELDHEDWELEEDVLEELEPLYEVQEEELVGIPRRFLSCADMSKAPSPIPNTLAWVFCRRQLIWEVRTDE